MPLMGRKEFELEGIKPYPLLPSTRALITVVFFALAFMVMANLFSMNLAITCMVNSTFTANYGNTSQLNSSTSCAAQSDNDNENYGGTYDWTRMQQSMVLAGTSMGAVCVVFIAGYYTDKLGAKIIGSVALGAFAIAAAVIPVAASAGWAPLFAVRLFQGLGIITGFPVYLVLANQWFPMQERGMLTGIGASGNQAGAIFSTLVTGYFCKSKFKWMGYFYTLAIANALCLGLWLIVYTDDIVQSRFLSHDEASYILRTRGSGRRKEQTGPLPWVKIVTSPAVWSVVCVNLGCMYMFFYIGDYVPTYYKEVLGISVGHSAILSSLPSLLQFFGRVLSGPIADRLERSLSRTFTVKLMTAISGYITAGFLIGASFFTCDTKYGGVACFSLAYFFFGFAISGFMRAPLLIAPPFTGAVCGFAQTAQFAIGLIVPYVSGAIVSDSTPKMWHWSIYTAAIVGIVGTTIFLAFGSGEIQSWARIDEDAQIRPSTVLYGPLDETRSKHPPVIRTISIMSEVAF